MREAPTVLNLQGNDNNNTGHYPVFLGPSLGFADEIHVSYPEIQKIFHKQRAAFWLDDEFTFSVDKKDLMDAPEFERDVMVLNILAQWGLDSMASRAIIEILGPFISNTEVHNWFLTQSFFESIHAATYSKIARTCFNDGNQLMERGKRNLELFERCKVIGAVFDETKRMSARYILGEIGNDEASIRTIKKQLLITIFTLYALEQISFMSSFTATFTLAGKDKYQQIATAVRSIVKDEIFHYQGDQSVLAALFSEPDYYDIYLECKEEIRELLIAIILQEYRWADYIFSEGRKVTGLNAALMKRFTNWCGVRVFTYGDLDWDVDALGEPVTELPLEIMRPFFDQDSIQVANQEAQSGAYEVGQIENDIDENEVFDF